MYGTLQRTGAALFATYCVLMTVTAQAYTCSDAAIFLSSQSEVDSFNCPSVPGDLTVKVDTVPSGKTIIADLSKLSVLTSVGGLLTIDIETVFANGPTQLSHIANITKVGSLSLQIEGPNAADMADLSSLLPNLNQIGPCTGGSRCTGAGGSTRSGTLLDMIGSEITTLPAVWAQVGSIGDQTNIDNLSLKLPKVASASEISSKVPAPIGSVWLRQLNSLSLSDLYVELDRLSAQASVSVILQGMTSLDRPPMTTKANGVTFTDLPALNDLTHFNNAPNYPNLHTVVIQGDSGVSGANLAPLASLSQLQALTLISLQLSDISGLKGTQLETITLKNLPNLTSLDGLLGNSNLRNVTIENTGISNLDSLRSMTGGIDKVEVARNALLVDVSGLGGITGVTREVLIFGNNALAECDVLAKTALNPVPTTHYIKTASGADCTPYSQAFLQIVDKATRRVTMDFGSVLAPNSATRVYELSNVGGSVSSFVEVNTAAITGAGFTIGANTCTGPLKGGNTPGSCDIEVTFSASSATSGHQASSLAGDYSQGRRLFSSASGPYAASVLAVGDLIADSLSPAATLDFDKVELQDATSKPITITNTGTQPLTIVGLNVANVSSGSFTLLSTTCGSSLAAGASCTVTVGFSPSAAGGAVGRFTLTTSEKGVETVNLAGTGDTAAAPSSRPAAVNFGDVVRGTTVRETIVVTNVGAVNSLVLGQLTAAAPFAVSADNCSSQTLTAGATCSVEIDYTPTAVGNSSGTLVIPATVGATGATPSLSVALSGAGAEPATLSADKTHVDFGLAPFGSSQTVTVTNIGSPGQSAVISSVDFIDLNPGVQFVLSSDTCTGATLASKATCSVTVQYGPTQDGVTKGTLRVEYGAGRFLSVAVSGRSAASDAVSPQSLSFGDVEVGTTSVAQTVTFTNTGTLSISITSIVSNDSQFAVTNNTCPTQPDELPASSSCTFDVAFDAVSQGHVSSFIEIISSSSNSPDHVIVDGFGRNPPQVHLSEPAVAFTQLAVGSQGASEVVTITNYGDEDLIISSLVLGTVTTSSQQPRMRSLPSSTLSTSMAVFTVDRDSCSGATLIAGASCDFRLVYSPTSISPVSTTLTINSNAVPAPTTLAIAADGVASPAAPVPLLPLWGLGIIVVLLGMLGAKTTREVGR